MFLINSHFPVFSLSPASGHSRGLGYVQGPQLLHALCLLGQQREDSLSWKEKTSVLTLVEIDLLSFHGSCFLWKKLLNNFRGQWNDFGGNNREIVRMLLGHNKTTVPRMRVEILLYSAPKLEKCIIFQAPLLEEAWTKWSI